MEFFQVVLCYNNYMKITSGAFENQKPEFVLKTVFGYDTFRPMQKEIIQSVIDGKDTLAVMPTGGGKSLCYQIPALILPGITVVVSPLISLMQDQVASLRAAGIHSVFLNSSLDRESYFSTVDEIKSGQAKIVYVSPEGLSSSRVRSILTESDLKVSCITVDEAHCLSAWGHDFRPDYLEINVIRNIIPDAVMIALTATATEQVRKDIITNLNLKKPQVFISSFNRSNIFLDVQPKRNSIAQIIHCIHKHKDESGIIYCYSRKKVDELVQYLSNAGFSVLPYHAGLSDEQRAKNQELFVNDDVQIMVATIAFGMGIDKPNVRYVINNDLPKSLEEYYQEIGRAGRDGLPSEALLLYSSGDIQKIRYFFDEVADKEQSERLLQNMVRFAETHECRRKVLLNYFGEKYEPKAENADCCCDICACGEVAENNVTIPAQKLMSCVIRTGERFGISYVVDVLLGSKQRKIIDNGHTQLSTWGIGKNISKEDWLALADTLIARNYLRREGDYKIIKVTYAGKSALLNRDEIVLPFEFSGFASAENEKSYDFALYSESKGGVLKKRTGTSRYGVKVAAQKPLAGDKEAERIVSELKNWRKRKADDMNVPPYIIFGDKTLYDIAAKKPKTKSEFRSIYGMGEAKIEQFGKSILRIVEGS